MPKLTELFVDKQPLSSKRITIWDSLLPAFGCRIGARTKTWLVIDSSGSRRKLGSFPSMKLSEARAKARELMHAPAPSTDFTLSEASEAYLASIDVRPNTHRFYKLYLTKLEARHGKNHLAEITARQCAEIIDSPHMHLALKVFFNWCKGQALLTVSPMENLKPIGKFKQRSRVLTDEELKKVWSASEQLGDFGCIVRLCILTGQRRGELSSVQPAWCHEHVLTIPGSSTKNKREHSLPLTTISKKLLSNPPLSVRAWSKPKKKLDQLSGVSGWTLHDLRRTFATTCARLGVPIHVVEALLNHRSGTLAGVAGIYNRHDYLAEMRDAFQRYERHLEQVIGEPLV